MNLASSQKTVAIIPARYYSKRFPGKPLANIAGKPMIQHVWERVKQTPSIDQILVATDDERILDIVTNFGGEGVLTSSKHETGTDRIVEVAQEISCGWVLNIQGDEPTVLPSDLDRLIKQTKISKGTKAATLIYHITDKTQLKDPNIVKVTVNLDNLALYFSRSQIPYQRSGQYLACKNWRHLGVYLFQRNFLMEFSQWPRSNLEISEQLEQLRILENGESILCVEAENEGVSVDVPQDLIYAENLIKDKNL
tara:strand:+ start:166 stop:921 length:756 start_codon:yes stop_codon:yes gene_type:complete